ncbi:50S ribosomal protein L25/general stress protein Ctc [Flaviflexus massiliensis]|uniref:50S ribosomal protein L25/general stress protein Ctc n=1 Tax=Flaviflexus massiliensis TaxID=1522309 RepID=UPI00097DF9E1|nr:50S ribosomal protein L25/general stress protein Ctc [Flaviflexus massiliensis]
MVDSVKLTSETREDFGKGAARRLRREGKVPAVVYGHGGETAHLALNAHETFLAVRYNANALVTVKVDGKSQLALVRDIQRHPMTWDIEHIDLIGVRKGEKVEVTIPVTVIGEPAPGTVVTTDVLQLVVQADATAIPETIEIDVEGKEEGTQIRVGDIVFPESVTTEMDPEDLVVSVNVPQVDTSIEEADAALAAEQSAEGEAEGEEKSEEDSE